jgi:hypothetical protein
MSILVFFDNRLPSRTTICLLSVSLSFSSLCLLLRENDIHRRRSVYSCTTGRTNWWPLSLSMCIMYYTMCTAANCSLFLFLKEKKKRMQHFSLSASFSFAFSFCYTARSIMEANVCRLYLSMNRNKSTRI